LLQIGRAFHRTRIVVRRLRHAGLKAGSHKCIRQGIWIPIAAARNFEGSTMPAALGVASRIVFHALEPRKEIFVTPTDISERAPVVVFSGIPAHIDHPVDRTGAAENFAARPIEPLVSDFSLRLRMEWPNQIFVMEQLADTQRNMNPRIAVGAPSFE